ncbi:flagellar protein FliT [Parendozoicomonas haliclonae]|uniref:Flagellar protein FliT n=1 Tax=Parendozoicomonas haliclonae TaxID=1960125 RepID=A0A1X7ANG9_9GAMM|nr:flagellar protein FliT [Parendozoicomonas haliclonae]SMA49672.1 hypothetical protein EHSB41UT_03454 [Parendozoicomonas haliclonae]
MLPSDACKNDPMISAHLLALEESLREAFRNKDINRVIALDEAVQEELKAVQREQIALPKDQVERLKALYELIRDDCSRRRNELSEKLKGMRKQRNAMDAYHHCQTAGLQ